MHLLCMSVVTKTLTKDVKKGVAILPVMGLMDQYTLLKVQRFCMLSGPKNLACGVQMGK